MIYKNIIFILVSLFFLLTSFNQKAEEIFVYADSIDYDSNKNLVAKGNVKIISNNETLSSDLIIINETDEKIILPKEFRYKDDDDNYYYGSSGEFSSNFENAKINDLKILLNDGSRIIGKEGYKNGKIDLINKGVYSPCESKVKIKNFLCPIWQIDGEQILHDREKLFIHNKHAKMRLFNIPIYYFPYVVAPSPLRKERKSGFLNPKISFNFLDTKSSQSTSFPYYIVLNQDKELLITPTINYGGGVDASQNITFDYDQRISGGNLSIDLSTDTNFENQDNESWLKDASLITSYSQNLNENYNIKFNSAFQSSPTYLRRTDENNLLNRNNTLSTSLDLAGYDILENNDRLSFNISGYQVIKENEDNKTTPTSFPYITYAFSNKEIYNTNYINQFTFYNIFRDISTDDHSQKQKKFQYKLKTNNEFYKFNSKLSFKTEINNQFYYTENKKIDGSDYTGSYERIFPMAGLYIETPIFNKKNKLKIIPKASIIINSSQSSSNKISNEESTNNSYSLYNNSLLNRYTGTDKLDNSQRVNYGFDINKDLFKFEISQSYEFNKNSNYNNDVGLNDYMSDLLGSSSYESDKNSLIHNFRFNVDQGLINSQSLSYVNTNKIGVGKITYSEERKENNTILTTGTETLKFDFESKSFNKYSNVNLSSTFDLVKDDPTEYSLGYRYFDECFGINIDFSRSFYEDRDLKPQDKLTIMFSFKNLGSYRSSNLAVSEIDKQDIRWSGTSVKNEKFK